MRRHPGPSHRQSRSKASFIAASLILALLVVIAIAARFSGSQGRVTYPLDSEFDESYPQTALRSEESITQQSPPSVSEIANVQSSPEKPKPVVAPKLQFNVLSSFSVSPITASAPSSPEQVAFVQGYEQLQPILSVTSYIPLNHQPVRGIIMPAGKALRLGSAYVAVQLLREELQCDLPIEIWHIAGEIDAHTKAVFETSFSGVTCRDATTLPYPSHHKPASIKGYALKAFALYATSFTEVILLDADNLPVLNPALLFDSPEYQLHGSMFWPDLFALPLSRVSGIQAQAYHLLGWSEPWAPSAVGNSSFMFAESGQFLLDRRRHADVVEWAWFINSYGDDGVYQQLMNGDKDSFLLAFALANKTTEYYQVPEYVRLCLHDVAEGSKLEHVGILHHNPQGHVAFFHCTSGGKVNPLAAPGQLWQAHYTTVPLPAQAAWDLFDGAAESGNYRYPRDRIQAGALKQCALIAGRQLEYRPSCAGVALQEQNSLPVSVLTQQDLQGTKLSTVYEASHSKFVALQEMMQMPDQKFLKELAWLR
ncbi:TPA: hypothetical protein ACH3X1_016046 [Trebouxia sp. C0004]